VIGNRTSAMAEDFVGKSIRCLEAEWRLCISEEEKLIEKDNVRKLKLEIARKNEQHELVKKREKLLLLNLKNLQTKEPMQELAPEILEVSMVLENQLKAEESIIVEQVDDLKNKLSDALQEIEKKEWKREEANKRLSDIQDFDDLDSVPSKPKKGRNLSTRQAKPIIVDENDDIFDSIPSMKSLPIPKEESTSTVAPPKSITTQPTTSSSTSNASTFTTRSSSSSVSTKSATLSSTGFPSSTNQPKPPTAVQSSLPTSSNGSKSTQRMIPNIKPIIPAIQRVSSTLGPRKSGMDLDESSFGFIDLSNAGMNNSLSSVSEHDVSLGDSFSINSFQAENFSKKDSAQSHDAYDFDMDGESALFNNDVEVEPESEMQVMKKEKAERKTEFSTFLFQQQEEESSFESPAKETQKEREMELQRQREEAQEIERQREKEEKERGLLKEKEKEQEKELPSNIKTLKRKENPNTVQFENILPKPPKQSKKNAGKRDGDTLTRLDLSVLSQLSTNQNTKKIKLSENATKRKPEVHPDDKENLVPPPKKQTKIMASIMANFSVPKLLKN